MNQIKKLAIVKLSAMGDIIHAMVVLQYIKKNLPNVLIDWFVEESFSQVLENNPHIDNIYKINLKSIKKNKLEIFNQIKLIKNYSKNNYDLVIDAQGLIKSAIVSRLLANKDVAGFDKDSIREKSASLFYNKKVSIAYDKNTIDRNVKVISNPLGFEITSKMILEKDPFLFYKDENPIIYDFLVKDKKNVLFVIGASKRNKIYPKENFLEIVKGLDENCLIIWGNNDEELSAKFIVNNSCAKMLPKIDLNTLKVLISKVDIVVGNDTGPSHMAWGLNIPSVTIYGNTPGKRNSYLTKQNKIIESLTKVDANKLNKDDFSINKINSKEVLKMIKELLNG